MRLTSWMFPAKNEGINRKRFFAQSLGLSKSMWSLSQLISAAQDNVQSVKMQYLANYHPNNQYAAQKAVIRWRDIPDRNTRPCACICQLPLQVEHIPILGGSLPDVPWSDAV